ncbi:heterokaryon incompatibility protein-domain-containing protein [Leptodontidium sp. MPI-SDFR-AT-0119]|nr:heterokaryon incompatibility protein-domain-containing protein [Leptodontidium sp. MPI-SDFR-AT-0119]
MWLINTTSLALEFIEDPETCIYAILSHTWGDNEVSFQDMADVKRARKKQGFSKIQRTCQLALDRNIEYAWVDTCCIDKSSSAELTEAINSMFHWYKQSHICFVFLSDLLSIKYLYSCRWFTRGWTLQELIASEEIEFYDAGWNLVGTNDSLRGSLAEITGIDEEILNDSDMLQTVPVARRMSWASSRRTTRVEDLAYCLFGIFDVNLPLIYGEGQKAFLRLQEAIAQEKNDLSLFAWTCPGEEMLPLHRRRKFRGMLAESPAEFIECRGLQRISDPGIIPAEVTITNQGFKFSDMLAGGDGEYLLRLDCVARGHELAMGLANTIAIRLVRTAHGYVRHQFSRHTDENNSWLQKNVVSSLPIPKTISPAESQSIITRLRHRFSLHCITNNAPFFLEYNVQKAPLHLWDHATQSFITDGYEYFTGIIDIKVTVEIVKGLSYSLSQGTSKAATRLIIIFGLVSQSNIHYPSGKQLRPWAAIYTDDKYSRPLSQILAQEKTHGFPHVARKAREFVTSREGDTLGPQLPTRCRRSDAPLAPFTIDPFLEYVLSTELVETPDTSLCKILVQPSRDATMQDT